MRKRIVASLLAAVALTGIGAQAADAADPPVNPSSMDTRSGGVYFAQQCDLPGTSARGRVIYTSLRAQIAGEPQGALDANLIKWQALSTSGAQASWRADQVRILVRRTDSTPGGSGSVWEDWQNRGGSINGGTDVEPNIAWDPDPARRINETYNAIRMFVHSAGGASCYTPATTLR